MVAAVVSLALGFYQSFRPGATDKVEWVQGVTILIAVVVITVIQAVNDYQKEGKFRELNKQVYPLYADLIIERRSLCQSH
jgi:P-type Ca2+ transporter type 2C